MSRLTLELPAALVENARKLAEQEHLRVEDYLSRVITRWLKSHDLWEERIHRGKQVSRERFLEILAKAPDVEPEPTDRIE